jgi:hypothetical protein
MVSKVWHELWPALVGGALGLFLAIGVLTTVLR